MELQNDFIRLTNAEPLTLTCSALVDFLWDDFVRDARATVNYYASRYNIKQLSRLGKEIFERLFTGDDVTWLVSLEDYETYFRTYQDTGSATLPSGYKPENGLWWSIMTDLTNAASWPDLLERCVGDQFNAGNNAVHILNLLSKVIEVALEQNPELVELLRNAGDKLKDLRDQFKKAVEKGDAEGAAKVQAQGKQLVQQLNEAFGKARQTVQPNLDEVVDEVIEESDRINEAMSQLWGSSDGKGKDAGNLQEKKNLAKKLKNNRELRQVATRLGALRRIWAERKRARAVRSDYAAVVGATFSNNVTKVFPSELALAGSEEGRALFALKYSQKTLLTKDYEAHSKHIGKGPIVMYIDVSGSMSGEREIWSKALALVIAEEAMKENRELQINLFDVSVKNTICIKPGENNAQLLDFVAGWTLGGGTMFTPILLHAATNTQLKDKADVLMITDGRSYVSDAAVRQVKDAKDNTGAQWFTLCIDSDAFDVCSLFSDEVYNIDISDQNKTLDIIQRCVL